MGSVSAGFNCNFYPLRSEYGAKVGSGVKADEDDETKRIVKAIYEMKEQMAAESAKLAALRDDKRKCQVNDKRTRASNETSGPQ